MITPMYMVARDISLISNSREVLLTKACPMIRSKKIVLSTKYHPHWYSLPEFGSLPSVQRFTEYFLSGTRQRSKLFFAEYHLIHLAKVSSLPSVTKTLGKGAVSVTGRRDGDFSFAEYRMTLDKIFDECPIKSTRQRSSCRCTVRALFGECYTRQRLH
jgi:hypothetical protein